MSRRAGILVPLFSIPSTRSWGIGEIGDIEPLARWLAAAGQSILQLLPINEMPPQERSPYSALSAMAIDPQFISMAAVEDFAAIGGEAALEAPIREQLDAVRAAPAIDYASVRALKEHALRRSFQHFRDREWTGDTRRASAFRAFCDEQSWWLDDYALFRALHAREQGRYWRDWPEGVRDRDPAALARARQELAGEIFFYSYLQWLAADQWIEARDACGIGVFGDFPFMVSGDSADVWSRQQDFRLDASVGAPPDAFSDTGQDWGFPAYRWQAIAQGGFRWLAARARRSAELYDGYRVDHLVGFFRTYVREQSGQAAFVPADQSEQARQGERVLEVLSATGARIIAEDLGVIPAFVRETLERLEIPGYKVLRWEREWDQDGQPFRNPAEYPHISVATSGTHDTETVAQWWDEAPIEERRAVAAIVGPGCDPDSPFDARVRDAIVRVLYASSSDIVLLPVHDIFGWRERVNRPALIDEQNWTWRLPWPVEELNRETEGRERAEFTGRLARQHGRL